MSFKKLGLQKMTLLLQKHNRIFRNQNVVIETIGTLSGLCVFELMTSINYLICLFLEIGIIISKHNYVNKIS